MTQHQGSSSAGSGPAGRRDDGGADHLKQEAGRLGRQVGDEARSEFDRQTRTAAQKADALADTMRDAADRLESEDRQLSHLVSGIASSLGELADGMRNKSADALLADLRRIARDNPTLMIAGSVAIGFGLVRFARASSHRHHDAAESRSARSVSPMGMGSDSEGSITEWPRSSSEPDVWRSEPMAGSMRGDRPDTRAGAGTSGPVTDRPLSTGDMGPRTSGSTLSGTGASTGVKPGTGAPGAPPRAGSESSKNPGEAR